MTEQSSAAQAFIGAALRLIARNRPSHEWSEAERFGVQIATELQLCFQGGSPDAWLPSLREARDALRREPGLIRTRYFAVRTIAEWGHRWSDPAWHATDDTRRSALLQFARELALHDEAFQALELDLDALAGRLSEFSPAPRFRDGKKSAEQILAEIIVEECDANGALGLRVPAGVTEETMDDAIEDIRAALARDVVKVRESIEKARK